MIPIVAQLLAQGLSVLGGAVMAKGKEVVEDKLGIKLPDSLTPEDALKLKQLEFQHEEWLITQAQSAKTQELGETKMYLDDVSNARSMQVAALAQSDIFAKRFVYYFAIGWSLATMLYIFGITFLGVPKDNVRFADTILGFMLGTLIATMIQFFFGSSKSSQAKDEALQAMTRQVLGGTK